MIKHCIHRRDAKDAEINDFLFAVERTAKRNHSIIQSEPHGLSFRLFE